MILHNCKIDKDKWYAEWCQDLFNRKGVMFPLSRIQRLQRSDLDTGYSTCYVFSKDDAEEIRALKSSRGFRRFAVGAWNVVIDLDDGESQLEAMESVLTSLGYGYEVYFSGSKGYHIYIPQTEFLYTRHLPHSHKLFVESLGVPCDLSLYQHGRIISMIGRVHPKTKVKKHFLKKVEGRPVDIEIVEEPMFELNLEEFQENSSLTDLLLKVCELSDVEPSLGNRHTRIWSLASNMLRFGLSKETVFELLSKANETWKHPKEDKEILLAVNQAERQLHKEVI